MPKQLSSPRQQLQDGFQFACSRERYCGSDDTTSSLKYYIHIYSSYDSSENIKTVQNKETTQITQTNYVVKGTLRRRITYIFFGPS